MVDGTYDNLTVNNALTISGRNKLNYALYSQSRQQLLDHLYKVGQPPDEYNPDNIPQYISFGNAGDPPSFMFGMTLYDGGSEPVLYWNRAFAARKDIIAGGRLDTQEGVVSMLGGVGWGPDGYDSNPFIWLVGNQHGYPAKDTLEIRISTYSAGWVWTWGNLEAGTLTAHGAIKSANNGAGYRSYYGGGGGGANGGIYLNEYGWARFDGGAGSAFWKVLTSAGSEVLAVPNATGAGVAIWLSCSMNPNGAGVLGCGSGSSYWAGVVAYRYYGKITTIGYFDTLDDLGLIKNYKATKNEEGKDVIDFSTLEFLKADDDDKKRDFYDVGKLHGFTFGCIKALVKRVEALEEQLSRNQKTALQTNTNNTEAEGA